MARTATLLGAPEADVDAINLRRVLLRLEQQILLPDADSRLLYSSFERDKVAQNLEYARTLLLRIQHNAPNTKSQGRKHTQQAELTRHRALIKRLTEKLYDMRRQDDVLDVDSSEEGEDILSEYFAPEPIKASYEGTTTALGDMTSTKPETVSEGLRSRNIRDPMAEAAAHPSQGPSTALRNELFATSGKPPRYQGAPEEMTAERQLQHQDATQAELTSSLVSLAQQLKASSLAFADELALDAETVGRTEGALGKNQEGLDAASKRMGVLRKMSEGRWWWQRYIMFIIIALLWVAEIALVFIGPKIRF